ncbi:MAG: RIP metalloprotease RseP [Pseudomonadales bacterium]
MADATAIWQSMAGFFWSTGAFIVAIAVLVAVHEFGHFWVARKLGVKVLRFSIGFGKALWCRTDKTGCEFVVAAIPLGGYVKMLDEREAPVAEAELHCSFNRQPVWKRSLIVLAGPMANFLLAAILFSILFSGSQLSLAPTVGKVTPDSLAARAGMQAGQEIIAVDGVATVSRADVLEALIARIGDTGDLAITVRFAENETTYELLVGLQSWLADTEVPDPIAGLGFQFYEPPFVLVRDVLPEGRAAQAGLRAEDVIETLDGQAVEGIETWLGSVRSKPEQALKLGVRREGVLKEIVVKPAKVIDSKGEVIGQIGAQIGSPPMDERYIRYTRKSPLQALHQGITETLSQSKLLLVTLQKLFVGHLSPKNLSGPLGIAKVAGDSAEHGLAVFCRMLAVLSINLGVVNLLPIPVLDGGLLLLYLIEAAKGSPVPEKVQLLGTQIGMALIASLMVFAIYNDVLRL